MRKLGCWSLVLLAMVAVLPVWAMAQVPPPDPNLRNGTIVVDGVEIDFWRPGAPALPPVILTDGQDTGGGVTGATPEPATLSLLVVGGLVALRRRFR